MVEKRVTESQRLFFERNSKEQEEVVEPIKKIRERKEIIKKEEVCEENQSDYRNNLKIAYNNIIQLLKEYLDLKEEYYNIIALWIIGTYFHDKFPSYPFLFFNAMKGSGKTRTMNLITCLSKDGEVLNAMTEAVLFRTKGTLAIDEYEGVTRKGNEGLRELLNSCYKRGTKVKRMKQQKTMEGTEQVVEGFEIYRPIVLANIWGMESVLGDRCIPLILDKSNRKEVTNLIELFKEEELVIETTKLLTKCSLCRCSFSGEVYKEWNTFVKNNYINYTNNTNNTNNTNYTQTFKTIKLMELNGRELELSFPLCLVAQEIEVENEDFLKKTTLTLKQIFLEKKKEELVENQDINLIDFISQQLQNENFITLKKLLQDFKENFALTEEWINSKWLGRALKRLNLIKQKRRNYRGVEIILDVEKAQDKIKMFK
jgi:hypothetical protein